MERTQQALDVVSALLTIKAEGPRVVVVGICANVDELFYDRFDMEDILHFWTEERQRAFLSWVDPMASGDEIFPIAAPYYQPALRMWEQGTLPMPAGVCWIT